MDKRILVVDDDRVVGQSFERVLTNKGYRVETALSGREAFEKNAGTDFDMVFTDLRMPGQDGFEVVRRIREMNPWLPIVVVTGYGTQEAEERARAIGVEEFLQKPLSPSIIETVAARILNRVKVSAAASSAVTGEVQAPESIARNVALFFAAPFIGLAYILAFPFVGLYAIARGGLRLAFGRR